MGESSDPRAELRVGSHTAREMDVSREEVSNNRNVGNGYGMVQLNRIWLWGFFLMSSGFAVICFSFATLFP